VRRRPVDGIGLVRNGNVPVGILTHPGDAVLNGFTPYRFLPPHRFVRRRPVETYLLALPSGRIDDVVGFHGPAGGAAAAFRRRRRRRRRFLGRARYGRRLVVVAAAVLLTHSLGRSRRRTAVHGATAGSSRGGAGRRRRRPPLRRCVAAVSAVLAVVAEARVHERVDQVLLFHQADQRHLPRLEFALELLHGHGPDLAVDGAPSSRCSRPSSSKGRGGDAAAAASSRRRRGTAARARAVAHFFGVEDE